MTLRSSFGCVMTGVTYMKRVFCVVLLPLVLQDCAIAATPRPSKCSWSPKSTCVCRGVNRLVYSTLPAMHKSELSCGSVFRSTRPLITSRSSAPIADDPLLRWEPCDSLLISYAELEDALALCDVLNRTNISCLVISIGRSHEVVVPKSNLSAATELMSEKHGQALCAPW